MDVLMRVAGKTYYMPYVAIASLVVNVSLAFLLLRYIGILGPAIASVFVVFFNAFLVLFFTRKIYGVAWKDLIPWWGLIKIIFVAALSVIPFYALKPDQVNLLELLLSFALYEIIFFTFSIFFRLTTLAEIKEQYIEPALNKINKYRKRYQ